MHDPSPEQASCELFELLDHSVALRLRADVTVGSCLSGGLDSSIIVGLIARRLDAPSQCCISAVFPGAPQIDESYYVDAVGRKYPQLHVHKVELTADELVSQIEKIIWHQEIPFATTSIIAQWAVFARARREGVTVMLDGQGADELYAGYHSMFGTHLGHMARKLQVLSLIAAMRAIKRKSGYEYTRLLQWAGASQLPNALSEKLRSHYRQTGVANWLKEWK